MYKIVNLMDYDIGGIISARWVDGLWMKWINTHHIYTNTARIDLGRIEADRRNPSAVWTCDSPPCHPLNNVDTVLHLITHRLVLLPFDRQLIRRRGQSYQYLTTPPTNHKGRAGVYFDTGTSFHGIGSTVLLYRWLIYRPRLGRIPSKSTQ